VFAAITASAGRTFGLNPSPACTGAPAIAHCTAFECCRTDQLEDFVKALTQPIVA
jgi:hypothetical protein